jgi:hypothetical protein
MVSRKAHRIVTDDGAGGSAQQNLTYDLLGRLTQGVGAYGIEGYGCSASEYLRRASLRDCPASASHPANRDTLEHWS